MAENGNGNGDRKNESVETHLGVLRQQYKELARRLEEQKDLLKEQGDQLNNQKITETLVQQSLDSINDTLAYLRTSQNELQKAHTDLKNDFVSTDSCTAQLKRVQDLEQQLADTVSTVEQIQTNVQHLQDQMATSQNHQQAIDDLKTEQDNLRQTIDGFQSLVEGIHNTYKTIRMIWKIVFGVIGVLGVIQVLANFNDIIGLLSSLF